MNNVYKIKLLDGKKSTVVMNPNTADYLGIRKTKNIILRFGSLRLFTNITLEYDLVQPDNAYFELSIDKIRCPDCNVKRFQNNYIGNSTSSHCVEKSYFVVEALAQTFGEMICSYTGALIIDLGVFFVVKSIYIMQLLAPSASECVQYQEQKEASIFETDEKLNLD